MPHHEEEWPVLFPDKPTTPDTLRQMTHQGNTEGPPKLTPRQEERYPTLPSAEYHPMSIPNKSINKASSVQKLERTGASSTYLRKPLATNADKINLENSSGNLEQTKGNCDEGSRNFAKQSTLEAQALEHSAGAAAIEKSTDESKPINQPRQTRTSSLRARLSAGQVIRDPTGKSKTVGFTDFTNVKEPLARASEGNLRGSKEFHSSANSANTRAHSTRPLKDSIHGSRVPAQFVAGSRRPSHRRPSSRGSIRSDSRASSPAFAPPPPVRSAPAVPHVQELPVEGDSNSLTPNNVEQIRSSIPVFRHMISNPITLAKDGHGLESKEPLSTQPKASRDEFSIYEDKTGRHLTELQAIKESPRRDYEIKRLSMTSPEHGPILRISPSADRLIMGTGLDKENQPNISKYKSKDARRAAVFNGPKNAKDKQSRISLKTSGQRPSSSQGLSFSTSRPSFVDAATREKKARSTDVSFLQPKEHEKQCTMTHTPSMSRKSTKSSGADDPFFDATDCLADGAASENATGSHDKQVLADLNVNAVEEEPWISPMPARESHTALSDATPVNPNYLPVTFQEHLSKDSKRDYKDLEELSKDRSSHVYEGSREPVNNVNAKSDLPTTPDQAGHVAGSFHSGSFPPRSSSHAAHPDYTRDGSAKKSPLSPLNGTSKVSRAPLQTYGIHPASASRSDTCQHGIGNFQDLASSRVDRTSLVSNRDSMARESKKSQGSLSKGVLSNFRGLFNKRSSENGERSSISSMEKGKQVRVTSAGSPFPSMSEIHPLHRPTQASINRAKAMVVTNDFMGNASATPSLASPLPSEVSKTTTLAMQILDLARTERSTPKQRRLLELGTIMVDSVTQARDAEKAMEEAKQAARKAEVAYAMCKKSLGDVTRCVEEWRDEMGTK